MSDKKKENIPFSLGILGSTKIQKLTQKNCRSELDIQYGFRKFYGFCKRMGSILRYSTFNFSFDFICKKKE